jgi:hypothetical protein
VPSTATRCRCEGHRGSRGGGVGTDKGRAGQLRSRKLQGSWPEPEEGAAGALAGPRPRAELGDVAPRPHGRVRGLAQEATWRGRGGKAC